MEKNFQDIDQWYDIHTEVYRAEQRFEETQKLLTQYTYELREATRKEWEYSRSLRKFLHKLTGKEDQTEALQRRLREAEAKFEMTALDWKLQSAKSVSLQEKLAALPTLEDLRSSVREDADALQHFAQRELELCTEMLQSLLAETDAALEDYRAQLRGEYKGRIASAQEVHSIGTNHIAPARQCAVILERMQEALELQGKDLQIPSYFENPAGFIVSAAAPHNRLDRISKALDQVAAVRKQLTNL